MNCQLPFDHGILNYWIIEYTPAGIQECEFMAAKIRWLEYGWFSSWMGCR